MRGGLTLAVLLIAACGARAERIEIVRNGRSDRVIVVPANPSASEMLAAEELGKYIGRMSGAKLRVQKGGELPPKALVVAERAHLGPWSDTIDWTDEITGDAYCISGSGSILSFVGGRGRSVLYAVYDFLDRLGCRWLAPDLDHYRGSAELVPRKGSLSVDLPCAVVERPALALRKLYVEEGHSHNAENLIRMAEWMSKARFNTLVIPTDYSGRGRVKWDNWREQVTPELQKRDITIEVGGHGYQNFLNAEMEDGRLFDQHPEWFGQDEQGNRVRSHNRVFCTSNPAAVDYLIANVAAYVKERPEIRIFDFWPPDGAKWCECDKCKALGTPSNRQAILVGKVKADVEKVRPDLRLEFIAYAAAVAPPESAKLDKEVLIDFCPIGQCFEVQINDPASGQNANYVTQLKGLRKGFEGDISIYSYYRKYAWKSLPNIIPHYVQNDLKFYLTIPVQGISSYAEPGDWFTYELNHYMLSQLAWNPSADADALVRKFCEARYGPAAEPAVSTFGVLEDVVRQACSIPGTSLKTAEELSEALNKLDGAIAAMKAAQSSAADAGVQRNIGRLLLTLEYARRDIEIRKSRAAKSPATETQKLVEELHAFVSNHAEDGVFLMHSRLDMPRLLQGYGMKE